MILIDRSQHANRLCQTTSHYLEKFGSSNSSGKSQGQNLEKRHRKQYMVLKSGQSEIDKSFVHKIKCKLLEVKE